MWVVTAASSANRKPETYLPYSGLCLQSGDVEEFTVGSCSVIDVCVCCSESVLEHHSEENPQECGSEDAALFHAVANVECL